jgi:hypothetical protein
MIFFIDKKNKLQGSRKNILWAIQNEILMKSDISKNLVFHCNYYRLYRFKKKKKKKWEYYISTREGGGG